jgi:hypothetical protein
LPDPGGGDPEALRLRRFLLLSGRGVWAGIRGRVKERNGPVLTVVLAVKRMHRAA